MMRKHLLVVDDDRSFRGYLKILLESVGYRVGCLDSGEKAVQAVRDGLRPSVLILDVIMEGMSGIEVLRQVREVDPSIPVIMLTGVDQTPIIVEAMRMGASDYLVKPFEVEELEIALRNVFEEADLLVEIKELRELLRQEDTDAYIFYSEKMKQLEAVIRQVASTGVTTLIIGESGVGKEGVARKVHFLSDRRDAPFVKINCAALPHGLLESELFGYEKGAFTGASGSKPGKFELANGGTIFLDEIGEMDVGTQAKMLQVLQDGEFCRLGGAQNVRADVRVLAASNRNLEEMVDRQEFRGDLYYRLNVIKLHVPPLRERKEDIPVLCDFFAKKFSRQFKKKVGRLPEALMGAFLRHEWPGNVRELENMIKRYVVLRDEETIFRELASVSSVPDEEDLAFDIREVLGNGHSMSLKDIDRRVAQKAECLLISNVLQNTRGNKRRAADLLEISYKALLYKIKECGIA